MSKQKLMDERHEILKQVYEDLTDELYAATLDEKKSEDDVEILRVMFDDIGFDVEEGAIGEFLFMPLISEEDEVQYFTSVITIANVAVEENRPKLYEALSIINYVVPCGAFVYDRDNVLLAYKLTTPISMDLHGEDLSKQVNICMGNAVAITDKYCDLLLRINSGEIDIDHVIEQVNV